MQAINAYFDGTVCRPLENVTFKKNQRLVILQLDDFVQMQSEILPSEKLKALKAEYADLFNDPVEVEALNHVFDNVREKKAQIRVMNF